MWANQKSSPSAAVATPLRAQWARDLAQGQELCNLPKFWLSDPHIMHRKAKVFPLQIMSHLLLLPKCLLHLHRCSIPFPFKMQAQNSYLLPILWLQSLPKIWMMPHPWVPQKMVNTRPWGCPTSILLIWLLLALQKYCGKKDILSLTSWALFLVRSSSSMPIFKFWGEYCQSTL